jgi:PPOX class probable F420-dependent enzyme
MDPDKRRQFVRDHRTCIFGYNRKNDGPAMTVVYYVMDGDDILVSTMDARSKAKAVDRDPHVSLCILDEHWPPTYLQVYGTATIERDPEQSADMLRRVIELMAGEPVPAERLPQITAMAEKEGRVVVRIRPYSTFATPPRHVNQMEDLDTLTHWTSNSIPW